MTIDQKVKKPRKAVKSPPTIKKITPEPPKKVWQEPDHDHPVKSRG
jgi:hypothetical protein